MYRGDILKIDDWLSQIKRGTLEFAILRMIRKQPCYGYDIILQLNKHPILAAKENTVYPLLRRLMKDGYLTSFWQESKEGVPPRKYYSITEDGLQYLECLEIEWNNMLTAMESLKGE